MKQIIVIKSFAIILCLAAISSCDIFTTDLTEQSSVIGIHVSDHSVVDTKSGEDETILSNVFQMDGGFNLSEYVSDRPFDNSVETKGQIITTNSANSLNTDGKSFIINGWLGESSMASADYADPEDISNRHFMSNVTATRSGGIWVLGENYWRNGIETTFWSYKAPSVGTLVITDHGSTPSDASLKELNFTYDLPASGGSDNDAALLEDFIVAYSQHTHYYSQSCDDDIDVVFHHPLAAVKFSLGSINKGLNSTPTDDEYVEITKVELIGVKTSGVFTATGKAQDDCDIACTSNSGTGDYTQVASRSEIAEGKFTKDGSQFVFFMIPQDLSGVKARITIQRKKKYLNQDGSVNHYSDTREVTTVYETPLSGSWESGKYYTYKINATVYFGGETVSLDPKNIYSSNEGSISVENGNIKISASGSTTISEYVAPLNTSGVKILKFTITHSYTNNSGKSYRRIWLENATLNPSYIDEASTGGQKYISTISTKDASLVTEAKAYNSTLFPTSYTGILGEVQSGGGGKYNATANDNNMNKSGKVDSIESTMYFFLGGKFDNIRIHFEYGGDTGGGSVGWTVDTPVFNITETIE